jgi:hypothetical protein
MSVVGQKWTFCERARCCLSKRELMGLTVQSVAALPFFGPWPPLKSTSLAPTRHRSAERCHRATTADGE